MGALGSLREKIVSARVKSSWPGQVDPKHACCAIPGADATGGAIRQVGV